MLWLIVTQLFFQNVVDNIQSFHCNVIKDKENNRIPKETNPPLVLKSSKVSPLSSGGGMGDQMQGGALAHS